MKRAQQMIALGVALAEVFVLAEILWFVLHDGEQTLHEAFGEWFDELRASTNHETAVAETLAMIQRLPETKNE